MYSPSSKPTRQAGDWAHERCARNGQCSRGGDHRHHVGVVDQIVAQHRTHHQNFVLEAGDKQRADRTVDQASLSAFLFGRAGLALEEATGDFARGIVFLVVVNRQREEILTGLLSSCAKVTLAMTLVSPNVAMTEPSA